MERNMPQDKQEKFKNTIVRYQRVIICTECGSSKVDHDNNTRITCLDCGNAVQMTGVQFALLPLDLSTAVAKGIMDAVVNDATLAFESAKRAK